MAPGRTIPKPIEDIILKAMAKEADKRFSTMAELCAALKAVLDEAVRSGAPLPAGVGASLNAGLAQPTAMDSVARPADQLPTMASRPMAAQPAAAGGVAAGYQPTMASVPPQQGQMAPPYQPTMASVPGGAAAVAPGAAAAAPGIAPSATSEVIPKTMFATGSGPAAAAAGAGVPTPMPMLTPVARPKKSNTGLIIGIVVGAVLLLGGGAVAAVVFWDKIVGDDGGGTAVAKGTGSGSGSAAAGTGSGTGTAAAAPKPDLSKVAVAEPKKDEPKVEPKDEPKKDEPKVEPKDEPKVEPKVEPKDEPKVEPKDEPKVEPKVIAKKKKGEKKSVEPKVEPKVIAKKGEPPEECCKIRVDSIPSDAAVLVNGAPAGRTPWVKKFGRNERVSVTLAKGGYLDTPISFTANENGTKRFKLKRRNLLGIPGGDPGAPGSDPFR
jgi:hypothetical protein